jgi:hypothetical protein
MAFCNSCGNNLEPGIRFCNKCGSPVLASTPVTTAPPPVQAAAPTPGYTTVPSSVASPSYSSVPVTPVATTTTSGGGALKIILIVVGVIVLIGVLVVGAIGFIGWRIAKRASEVAHVTHEGNHTKVETPFGNVESGTDPQQVARDLDVAVYPGATMEKDGASTATFMGIHTTTASYLSSDSLQKVDDFYKAQFPNAMMTNCDTNSCTVMSTDQKNTVTIKMEAEGSGTKITLTRMVHKAIQITPPTTN